MPPVGHQMPAALISLPGGKPIEFIDAHPYPPLGRQVSNWNEALAAFPSASTDRVRILAGDFNASLDHAAMRGLLARGYKDAADQVGAGLIPTWPANKRVPPIITIDHVLVDERVGVREVSVHDVPGTDHRAVLAELTVP
jgi:endonuclease/exonuclease/phosphatase family metal-dependent hydrolase